MSGNEKKDGAASTGALHTLIVPVIVALALLVIFGSGAGKAKSVNLPGAVFMAAGLAVNLLSGILTRHVQQDRREKAGLALRLFGLLLCAVGAILIICL